jgi:DNA-binding NtrC family response regulator
MGLPSRVLTVCSSSDCHRTLTEVLGLWEVETISASTTAEARATLGEQPISLVFCENHLSDGGFGELASAVASRRPPVHLVAILRDESEYADAIRLGAFEAILLPCRRSDIQWVIIRAMNAKDKALLESPNNDRADTPASAPSDRREFTGGLNSAR